MDFLDARSIMLFVVFVVGSGVATLAAYGAARVLLGNKTDDGTRELSSSIIFRISALHGLILALVFAQELFNYNEVRGTISKEAIAVGDAFFDLGRTGSESTLEIRKHLSNYAHAVVHDEWPRLGRGEGLSPTAWKHWEAAYQGLLDLEGDGQRHERLMSHVVSQIQSIAGYRRERENAATYSVSPLFWLVALVGIVLIAFQFLTYPATALNSAMLVGFGAYTGLVLYAIAAFANPYNGPAILYPVGMDQLLKTEMANFHTGG